VDIEEEQAISVFITNNHNKARTSKWEKCNVWRIHICGFFSQK